MRDEATDVSAALRGLRLHGMAAAWADLNAQGGPGAVDSGRWLIEHLLQAEACDRAVRSVNYQMGAAKFPAHRDLASFEFESSKVDRGLVEQLADMAGVLARDLGDAAREHARDMGYSFAGPIQTTFVVSPDLRPGVFEVEATHKEGDGSPVGSLLLPTGDRVPLGQYVVSVGRQTDCTIVLGDPKVSRRHAEVRPSGDGFVLVDLNSTNGSYINRQRISQHQLVDGDELGFGHTYFFFEAF